MEEVIKSENDDRNYKYLTFDNKLRLLLISDPTSEKSAASATIYVGSSSDPENVPGIAHFCEHMLFLGTKKYPNESEYSNFIRQNGGSYNAYTCRQCTNYYFDIKSEFLYDALDRFAQFFISPLLTSDATERELNAIDSEHQKNVLDDFRRKRFIYTSTAKEGHVYRKFGTGNLETLKHFPCKENINIRNLLIEFHSKYYSANVMTVAVLGTDNLESMEKQIAPLFAQVENKDAPIMICREFPFSDKELGTLIKIPPVKELKKLELEFQLPDLREYYRCKPSNYVSHIINHEGKGSLLSLLKKKSWAHALSCYNYQELRGVEFFVIKIDLTDEGVLNIDDIIGLCFQHLNMIKEAGPKEELYQEMKVLQDMQFKFKDKEQPISYVCELSVAMHEYPPEDILYGHHRLDSFQPELISKVLDYLNPSNFRCMVLSQIYKNKTDRVCKYYNADYSIEKIDPKLMHRWINLDLHPELHLPKENKFIPESVEVRVPKTKEPIKSVPILVKDNELIRVWYKSDDTYFLPKSVIRLKIFSPIAGISPKHCNELEMFAMLLEDDLVEYGYDAKIAGLYYGIYSGSGGLHVYVSGYNDKQLVLLRRMLETMVTFEVKPGPFEIHKVKYVERLKNFELNEPYQQVRTWQNSILYDKYWTPNDKLKYIDQLTLQSLNQFIPQLFKSIYIECLLCGNLLLEDVEKITSTVEEILIKDRSVVPMLPQQLHLQRRYKLQHGVNYLFEKRSKMHSNSCIHVYMEVGLHNVDNGKMMCEVIAHISSSHFFDVLRTKEQLGYIVWNWCANSDSVTGMSALIQSDKTMAEVDERIDDFFTSFEGTLDTLTEEQFRDYVEGFAIKRLEKPKQLHSEVRRYWNEILSKQYHFQRSEVEVEIFRKFTKEEVLAFYKQHISPTSKDRRKLAVVVLGTDAPSISDQNGSKWKLIDDVLTFQSSHETYEHISPYNEIPLVSAGLP